MALSVLWGDTGDNTVSGSSQHPRLILQDYNIYTAGTHGDPVSSVIYTLSHTTPLPSPSNVMKKLNQWEIFICPIDHSIIWSMLRPPGRRRGLRTSRTSPQCSPHHLSGIGRWWCYQQSAAWWCRYQSISSHRQLHLRRLLRLFLPEEKCCERREDHDGCYENFTRPMVTSPEFPPFLNLNKYKHI